MNFEGKRIHEKMSIELELMELGRGESFFDAIKNGLVIIELLFAWLSKVTDVHFYSCCFAQRGGAAESSPPLRLFL